MATPYAIRHLSEVGSTQDEAARVFHGMGESALLLYADRQVGGRGRAGREWWEADRAMYASLAMRPEWEPATWPRLSLVAGLAARDAVLEVFEVTADLKWPNDLVVPTGKVGGVLAEAGSDTVVVGCGMNVWWPDAPDGAAALQAVDPGAVAVRRLVVAWADRLAGRLDRGADDWGCEEYRAACVTLGKDIVWDPDGAGTAVDIAADGGLVVETVRGRIVIRSGEVRRVRGATVSPDDQPGGEGAAAP
jgi:BirA family biotin operon repressor/biotin-[acetyl-CoA-carboxylase] ligase